MSPTAEHARRAAARRDTSSGDRRATARRRARLDKPIGYRVSAAGVRFGLFNFAYLRQTKGKWRGHPLQMEPWQLHDFSELLQRRREAWLDLTLRHMTLTPEELWRELRDWMLERGDFGPGNLRVYREGLIGEPKKNGKSTSTSGLALYLLAGDDEGGAEVYSLASAKDQAKVVFNQAREMVMQSPALLEILRLYVGVIAYPRLDGIYRALSADVGIHEGINPHGAIADEIHAHKERALYDLARSAMIAREQPLMVGITTGGVTFKAKGGKELNLLGDLYQRGAGKRPKYRLRKLAPELAEHGHKTELSEVKPRPELKGGRFFFRWYEVPWEHREDARYWAAANPASWLTAERLEEESDIERPRGIFYRYHLNITTSVERHWLRPAWLAATKAPRLRILERDGVVITIDIGLEYDTTALTVTRVPTKDKPRLITRSYVWGVHDDPKAPPPPAHKLLPEGPIDLDMVEETVRAIAKGTLEPEIAAALQLDGPLRVIAIGADPHKFETQLQHLDTSFNVFRFDQGPLMTKASEELYRAFGPKSETRLAWNGDAVTEAHYANSTMRDVGNGRFRLDKKAATDKMDAAVSTAMGTYMITQPDIVQKGRPSFTLL